MTDDSHSQWNRETEILADKPSQLRDSRHRITPITVEERNWAMLSHLSILLNLFSGFLGGVTSIIIYFVYKGRSRFVAYHAMQAFIFQAITWLGAGLVGSSLIALGGALWFLILPLIFVIIGFVILMMIPASLIYGVVGAVQVNNSEDFQYWQISTWVCDILEPDRVR